MEVESGGGQPRAESSNSGGGPSRMSEIEKASLEGGKFLGRIRKAFESIKEKIGGRKLFKRKEDGVVRIVGKDCEVEEGEKEVKLEEVVGSEGEDEVEMVVEEEKRKDESSDSKSVGSVGTARGYGFLDQLEEDVIDEEQDVRNRNSRKRKADTDVKEVFRLRGLLSTGGWKERAKMTREDGRWIRKVERQEEGRKIIVQEKIPLPAEYNLGLDSRGLEMNSAARKNHNMGSNRKAVFPRKDGRKGEASNWIANFTRAGCIGCRDEKGENAHVGRSSDPVILVIGDEATPVMVGYTKKGESQACCWTVKKEHLVLAEVVQLLRNLNEEKKDWDLKNGRRTHEFFIPNGSKILVSSYTHLRREGLEGYISDFNNMVKDVWALTGDIGIEVLPVVPVIYADLDGVGGQLLAGVRDWIEWVGEQAGKEAVAVLSRTGGSESSWARTSWVIYRPSFVFMSNKDWKEGEEREWRNRGNRIAYVRG